jgi:hypothetical protein
MGCVIADVPTTFPKRKPQHTPKKVDKRGEGGLFFRSQNLAPPLAWSPISQILMSRRFLEKSILTSKMFATRFLTLYFHAIFEKKRLEIKMFATYFQTLFRKKRLDIKNVCNVVSNTFGYPGDFRKKAT